MSSKHIRLYSAAGVLFLVVAGLIGGACEDDGDTDDAQATVEQAAEDAGEAIGEGAEEVPEAIGEGVEDIVDEGEDAVETVDDELDDLTDGDETPTPSPEATP